MATKKYLSYDRLQEYDDLIKAYADNADASKMDKENPTGTGSFSLNRKADTDIGANSFAEGSVTTASGDFSHAEGNNTTASSLSQHVQGEYNVLDTESPETRGTYAHIVGNGSSDTKRSNAHTLDWEGNAWFAGDVYVGSTSGTNKDEGSRKLASITETWTFTLEDGSTVTKAVYVG